MSLLSTLQSRPAGNLSDDDDDDDLDSDYHPGKNSDDEENLQRKVANLKKRKRKCLKSPATKSNKRRNLRSALRLPDCDEGSKTTFEGFQSGLPPEVFIKIFQFGIASEGFKKFIPRVAQVCKDWNRISSDQSLAKKLDLGSDQGLLLRKKKNLLPNLLKRDLSLCQELSLHGQVNMGSSALETILNLVPRLVKLDLCGCVIKQNLVESIPQLCPLIQSLNLSSLPGANYREREFSPVSVLPVIQSLGPNLVELRLCNLWVVANPEAVFLKVIQENCPNLEELDLGTAGVSYNANGCMILVNISALASGCPRLRELSLDGFIINSSVSHKPHDSSFGNLQVYSQSRNRQRDVDMPVLFSLFSAVKKLKVLNISHSRLLPSYFTHWLKEVEEAYLQGMILPDQDQPDLVACVGAWMLSLRTLDMSYNKPCNGVIDQALFQYEIACEYPLEVLNLTNTNVTSSSIIHVINACKNLKEINLSSCRELPRGSKREFQKQEFPFLLQLLERSNDRDGV